MCWVFRSPQCRIIKAMLGWMFLGELFLTVMLYRDMGFFAFNEFVKYCQAILPRG